MDSDYSEEEESYNGELPHIQRPKMDCPLQRVHKQRNAIKKPPKNKPQVKVQALKDDLRRFFWHIASYRCQDSKNPTRRIQCSCWMEARGDLSDEDIESILEYLYDYALLEYKEQRMRVAEWMKYAIALQSRLFNVGRVERRKLFLIPGVNKPEAMICSYALCDMLGMTYSSWEPLWTKVKAGKAIFHGNTGKANKTNSDQQMILADFFEDMKGFAGPRATRIVRDLVRGKVAMKLRDDDADLLELPTSFTKRNLYCRYVVEQGWTFKLDSTGRVVDKTAVDEDLDEPASWPTFLTFWKKNHPKLVIPNASEDICNECFVYANRHKYSTSTDPESTDALSENNEEAKQEAVVDTANEQQEGATKTMLDNEAMILKASNHVHMAQAQRKYFQDKKKEAFDTRSNKPSERVITFVADFAQNLSVPNFASEQPGDTYYMVPLNCYCFGIADASTDPIRLAALMYTEDGHKKGGDNVASLLWYNLERLGILSTTEPFKEINIFMDNCGGQNKNKMVLRLLFYLVKRKVAVDARITFLFRGHTKNDCDRLFNLLKKDYRKSNVYTPKDLEASVRHDHIDSILVDPHTTFRGWNAHQDLVMKATVGINVNHCFLVSINKENGNSMLMETHHNSGTVKSQRVVTTQHLKNTEHWTTMPELIPPSEMLDIKWIELHDKWGKFVPQDKKADWKYYNEDPGPLRRGRVKDNKKQSKQARLARTRTDATGASEVAPPKSKKKKTTQAKVDDAAHPSSVI